MGRARWVVVLGTSLSSALVAPCAYARDGLRSVYVVSKSWGFSTIVSAESAGLDVRVRVIDVSRDQQCSGAIVQAVEQIVPRTGIAAVAGVDVCSLSHQRVTHALKSARSQTVTVGDAIPGTTTVVAICGRTERIFVFQDPTRVDLSRLMRSAPDVEALRTLGGHLTGLFKLGRRGDPFDEASPDQRAAQEALGTSLVPELVAGKYAAAYRDWCWKPQGGSRASCASNYLAGQLDGYRGPQRGPLPAEIVDRDSLGLVRYVEPTLPPIALAARVFGDVRLSITADRQTGKVTDAEPISGHPLHIASAVDATRQWQFAPGSIPREPIEVTLRFQLRCPAP